MEVLKNSIVYLGSSIFSKSIPFLLLPVMTKYLTPSEYGILSIYLILISLYSAFIGMALHSNISKNFFRVNREELSMYIGNILILLSITFSFYLLITYGVSIFYDSIFSIPSNWLLLIPFISIMTMINEMNTTILRNEQRAYMFGIFEVSNSFINMFFTVLFLIVFSIGWYSQVVGILINAVVFFLIGITYMKRRNYITMKFDKEKMKSILNISIPLIPHILGATVIAMSDRLFIEHMVSLKVVGIYSVGYMFGMIVMLFTDAFIKAWSPWFYKSLVNPNKHVKSNIVKYSYYYIIAIFCLAFFISFVAKKILPYFVDEKFYGAEEFISWIAIGYAIQGIYKIFFPYLVHLNKTSFLALSTTIAAILNLLFNYIFIEQFGAIGAAYATAIAFSISAILVFWYQSKYISMPWLGYKND